MEINSLDLARAATVTEDYKRFKFYIYKLDQALAPGDSLRMNFKGEFRTRGFKEGGPTNQVVFNGTFFNNTFFPTIGYNSGFELTADDDRKDNDLPERERQMKPIQSYWNQHEFFRTYQ